MALLSELRLHQNVFLPSIPASGVVMAIDAANRRVRVNYKLRRQRPRHGPAEAELHSGWFALSDLAVFHFPPYQMPDGPKPPIG